MSYNFWPALTIIVKYLNKQKAKMLINS